MITGGARGQGAAEGALLRERGAEVVLTDVRDEMGQGTADRIGATYLHLDVADPQQWESVVQSVHRLGMAASTDSSTTQASGGRRRSPTPRSRCTVR